MHPANVKAIQAASIDVCCLANNHTLDWGYDGLLETLQTLKRAGLRFAGGNGMRSWVADKHMRRCQSCNGLACAVRALYQMIHT
jgi:poly-gamma-glutamate capsule biosynthesis protein CapA/YwtB (metallophosphatase superfamily)